MDNNERIQLLEEAQALIYEAIDAIKSAMRDHPSWSAVEGYLVSSLEQAASDENQWIGGKNPKNIQAIIEGLDDDGEDDYDDDENY